MTTPRVPRPGQATGDRSTRARLRACPIDAMTFRRGRGIRPARPCYRARRSSWPRTATAGALIEPLLPEPNTGGRPEKHPRREIVNAILYVVRSGCPWRYLPADLPPWQTVYWYFTAWEQAGVTEKLLAALRIKAREQAGRDPQPSAGIIDSQSVKGADTLGLLVVVVVLAASWQDRDGAKSTLLAAYAATPIRHVIAGQGFAGKLVDWAKTICTPRWRSCVSPPSRSASPYTPAAGS